MLYLPEELLLSRQFGLLFEMLNFVPMFDGLRFCSPLQSNVTNRTAGMSLPAVPMDTMAEQWNGKRALWKH